MTAFMDLTVLLDTVKDGDERGWRHEFAWLEENDGEYMAHLMADIAHVGITNPILIGNDGRVWDGHHRIYAAWALDIERVPVEFVQNASIDFRLPTEVHPDEWVYSAPAIVEYARRHGELQPPRVDDDGRTGEGA